MIKIVSLSKNRMLKCGCVDTYLTPKIINVFVCAKKQTIVDKNVLCIIDLMIVACISNFMLISRTIGKLLTVDDSFTFPTCDGGLEKLLQWQILIVLRQNIPP